MAHLRWINACLILVSERMSNNLPSGAGHVVSKITKTINSVVRIYIIKGSVSRDFRTGKDCSPFIRGMDGFEFLKKLRSKILWYTLHWATFEDCKLNDFFGPPSNMLLQVYNSIGYYYGCWH